MDKYGNKDRKKSGRSLQQQTRRSSVRRIFSAGYEDTKKSGRSQQKQTLRSSLRRIFSVGRNNSSSASIKPGGLDKYGYNDTTSILEASEGTCTLEVSGRSSLREQPSSCISFCFRENNKNSSSIAPKDLDEYGYEDTNKSGRSQQQQHRHRTSESLASGRSPPQPKRQKSSLGMMFFI